MQYKTEQYILQVIKQAVQQEVEIIKDDYESLKKVSSTLTTCTKELNQAKKENEALKDSYKNSRELIKRLESKFDTIEPISHSESHVDEYGN
jgi:cell division protein FtsB